LPEAIVRIRKYQPRTAATDEDGRRRPRWVWRPRRGPAPASRTRRPGPAPPWMD